MGLTHKPVNHETVVADRGDNSQINDISANNQSSDQISSRHSTITLYRHNACVSVRDDEYRSDYHSDV